MNIEQILKELYELDPSLKKHEADLKKIIKKLIKSKPDTMLDEKAIAEIKQQLLKEAAAMKKNNEKTWFMLSANRQKQFLALTSVTAVIAIAFIAVNQFEKSQNQPALIGTVSELSRNAFGSLSLSTTDGLSASEESASIMGMGEGDRTVGAPLATNEKVEMSVDREIGIMPPMYRINFDLAYEGEDISISESEMEVYKKITKEQGSEKTKQALNNLNFDLIDFDKLNNIKLSNINFYEDKEFGYSIYIDSNNNNISIFSNWKKWPDPYANCNNEKCFNEARLSLDEVPSDEEIIAIANSFLNEYGINTSEYGKPKINDYWRDRKPADVEIQPHIPDSMQVVYPFLVEGKPLNDESGNETGLYVSVNIRYKKVESFTGLSGNDYQKSLYEIENSSDALLKIALDGGLSRIHKYEDPTETITVKLGTPEIGLLKYYNYNEASKENNEFYMPALFFPVTEKSNGVHFYRNNIVVPLPKDIINNIEDNYSVPYRAGAVIAE